MRGKGYLLELFRKGYPVIPSVDSIENLPNLGNPDRYIIKPKNGLGSAGIEVLAKDDLLERKPNGYIIQPLLQFASEVSFYFIDNAFQYALAFEPNRGKARLTPKEFVPSQEELKFAQTFINWNSLQFGIQRIDALKFSDGSLLLLEIEDSAQLLSLLYISEAGKARFLGNLEKSISKTLLGRRLS